jgi:hypothetical protein
VWLVSRRFDLCVFLGPAVLALFLVALEPLLAPRGEVALPTWIGAVLLIDVAHVWSTIYRTYLDPEELGRRPALYAGVPILAYAAGVLAYAVSAATFWTALAYLAVFHFVRQQYGWVALYDRRLEAGRLDRVIDKTAIYAATIFPILWWHAHLPRGFDWFVPGDFVPGLPTAWVEALWPIYLLALFVFAARQGALFAAGRRRSAGKLVVVVGTAACWGVGIIARDTDFAFTVTNVLIHGVPYLAMVFVLTGRSRAEERTTGAALRRIFVPGRPVRSAALFLALVALLAYLEELGWDRLVWHERPELFPGPAFGLPSGAAIALVPLLALPQSTHYLLDAWIWRGKTLGLLSAVAPPRVLGDA